METDKELYTLEKDFPEAFVKFAKIKPKGNYLHSSLELKKLSTRVDCIYKSDNANDPIVFIENQGYKEKSFYLRFNQGVSLYCKQKKHYGKVIKVALFINKKSYNIAKLPDYNKDFIVYVFSEMSLDELKSFNDSTLLILAPLCKATEEELVGLFNEWKEEVSKNKSYSKLDKDNLFGIFGYLFGEMHKKSPEQLSKLLGVNIMKGKLAQEIERRGFEKGREEGREEEKVNTARNLKHLGISLDKISKATGLSIEEIEKL